MKRRWTKAMDSALISAEAALRARIRSAEDYSEGASEPIADPLVLGAPEENFEGPGFVMKTVDDTGRKVIVHISGHFKIQAPSSEWANGVVPEAVERALAKPNLDDPEVTQHLRFPLSVSDARNELDNKGAPCTVYDAVFNDDVIWRAYESRPLQVFLGELVLQWIAQKYTLWCSLVLPPHRSPSSSLPATIQQDFFPEIVAMTLKRFKDGVCDVEEYESHAHLIDETGIIKRWRELVDRAKKKDDELEKLEKLVEKPKADESLERPYRKMPRRPRKFRGRTGIGRKGPVPARYKKQAKFGVLGGRPRKSAVEPRPDDPPSRGDETAARKKQRPNPPSEAGAANANGNGKRNAKANAKANANARGEHSGRQTATASPRASQLASNSEFLRMWSSKVRKLQRRGDITESDYQKIKTHLVRSVYPGTE